MLRSHPGCRYDVEHPVVNDADMRLWYALGISSWPTQVVVSPTGKLLIALAGEDRRADIDACVQAALDYYGEAGLLVNGEVPVVRPRSPARLTLRAGGCCPAALRLPRTPRAGICHILNPASRAPAVAAACSAFTVSHAVQELERDKQAAVVNTPLRFPGKLAVDERGGRLFIADSSNHRILAADLSGRFLAQVGGNGSGLVDGPAERAAFNRPQGLAYCNNTDRLYVADTESHAVRCVDWGSGTVSTLAGNGRKGGDLVGGGRRGAQQLNSPWDVALADDGRRLLVAMAGQHQIWELDLETGVCAALSGSGAERNQNGTTGAATAWAQPSGLALTPGGGAACAPSCARLSARLAVRCTMAVLASLCACWCQHVALAGVQVCGRCGVVQRAAAGHTDGRQHARGRGRPAVCGQLVPLWGPRRPQRRPAAPARRRLRRQRRPLHRRQLQSQDQASAGGVQRHRDRRGHGRPGLCRRPRLGRAVLGARRPRAA